VAAEAILRTAFAGAALSYLLGRVSARVRDAFAVALSAVLVCLVAVAYGQSYEHVYYPDFLGLDLVLRMDPLSWFFAITVSLIGCLSVLFSLRYVRGRERVGFYYFVLLLVNAAMLGIVFSGDLLSFFIFWEVMSWAAYLLISYNRGRALHAGMKFIVMSVIGSCAMLVGLLSLYAAHHTLVISELAVRMGTGSTGFLLGVVIAFAIGFGIKSAMVPLHTWLPDAHSEAPSPFSAVLSGVLIKMGIYGFVLVMYALVGLELLLRLGSGWLRFSSVLCWLGAITILVPTFIALLQDDAKRLLAWSSIGQIGYIVLGLGFATSLGLAGALFHTFNHAVFKALLFLAVGAVEYRTGGVRNLNELGGLGRRMPVTFACALVGGLGLIGVPLSSGFVSKWLIYRTLIAEGHPFLALAALVGTWGAILYVYKLLHNMFLGQLPQKYASIEAAPFSMQLPLAVCALLIVLFGVLPGIPLGAVGAIVRSVGLEPAHATLSGFGPEIGPLNTVNILAVFVGAVVLIFVLLRATAGARRVAQDDSYAAGAYVPADRYHHTVGFYDPLETMTGPYLRDWVDAFYLRLAGGASGFFSVLRRVYTGDVRNYVTYIVGLLAFLLFVQMVWRVW
jgi:proton-translocating NADH-quinone oxidoreductase chain M